jgi:glucose/arabinose dehydrogenase
MTPLRSLVALLAIALIAAGCASSGAGSAGASSAATAGTVASGGAASLAPVTGLSDIGAGLQGPPGLAATVYATDLLHASAFTTDSQGRLWVATADFTDTGIDAVYVIPAAGASPLKVIAALHTPLGLLWIGSSLYVASAGRVDAYSDFNGTAFASHTSIVTFESGVGEVNGLILGPDGRIRLGISSPCDHCSPTTEWSASVVSFLPDGSDLRTEAAGIRAPIDFGYVPGTNDLLVTMNQRDDLGAATPGDWLAVVARGQNWGFPGCYGQGGTACAGAPSPVAALDAHAAVSGLAIVTGQLGGAVGTAAVVAEWATGRVLDVPLRKAATGYTGVAAPLLVGFKNPEPVLLDATGGLLVGDWGTGTVYRITTA